MKFFINHPGHINNLLLPSLLYSIVLCIISTNYSALLLSPVKHHVLFRNRSKLAQRCLLVSFQCLTAYYAFLFFIILFPRISLPVPFNSLLKSGTSSWHHPKESEYVSKWNSKFFLSFSFVELVLTLFSLLLFHNHLMYSRCPLQGAHHVRYFFHNSMKAAIKFYCSLFFCIFNKCKIARSGYFYILGIKPSVRKSFVVRFTFQQCFQCFFGHDECHCLSVGVALIIWPCRCIFPDPDLSTMQAFCIASRCRL